MSTVKTIEVQPTDVIIIHFPYKEIGLEKLQDLANKMGKISPCNVVCFDSEVEVTVVKNK